MHRRLSPEVSASSHYLLNKVVLTVIEQLAQRTTLVCPTSLCSIHGVKGLVEEETNRPRQIDPRRTVGVERRIVPKHRQNVDNDEAETGKGDLGCQLAPRI